MSISLSLLDLSAELGGAAATALRARCDHHTAIPDELSVQVASRPEFGDLQIAGCLQLAKPLGKKPRDLAQLVVDTLASHPDLAKVEIAGPGYVNLHLNNACLGRLLAAHAQSEHHGVRQRFAGQSVVVDYSSPNVAKPMHIGHIRSTIIGAALSHVLRAVGYRVITDNHLGDWGTQFGKLIVAYRSWLDVEAYQRAPIAELVRLYQKFVSEEKAQAQSLGIKKPDRRAAEGEDEEGAGADDEAPQAVTPLLAQAREELAKLQAGDAANHALWQEFVRVSLQEFHRTYARLGVVFDHELGESFYNDRLAALVESLLQLGLAEPSLGAIVCPVEGAPAPLLVRKADGAFLYGTTDVATIEYRVRTFAPRRILYVVGAPQQLHFKQVFAVALAYLRKTGLLSDADPGPSLEHLPFGSMRFRDAQGNWSTGSTRLGNVPLLDEFLDMATEKARSVAREKNAELRPSELEEVARIVGIGAIKYNDLCRDRIADIHFDLDKAMALDGNTAPYIQYAYARMRSIHRKAASEGITASAPTLLHPAERALALRILDYGAVGEKVAESCKPHTLCEYLYELAGAVSTFYSEVPVLKAEPAERASRLGLLDLAAKTLRHGLSLLGIAVPERM